MLYFQFKLVLITIQCNYFATGGNTSSSVLCPPYTCWYFFCGSINIRSEPGNFGGPLWMSWAFFKLTSLPTLTY